MDNIWSYLESLEFPVTPRPDKKTVQLVLESRNLNGAQKKRMTDRWMIMEKLDGVFSFITVIPMLEDGHIVNEVRHWSRTGRALSGCSKLDEDLRVKLQNTSLGATVLISEITSEGPLAKLSGYLNPDRVNPTETPPGLTETFHDMLLLSDFIVGESVQKARERYRTLSVLCDDCGLPIIPFIVGTFELGKDLAHDWIMERKEGAVLRDPEAYWVAGKRDERQIKVKEKLSFDVTVVGMCSGKVGSKYENTLGKLLVAFRAFGKPDGTPLVIPISGMTDKQRDEWWNDPDLIVEHVVKMDAKSFTETGNLREPRFKEVRHDKESEFPVEFLPITESTPIVVSNKAKATWVNYPYDVD